MRAGSRSAVSRIGALVRPARVEPFESALVFAALVLATSTFGVVLHDTTGSNRASSSSLFAPLAASIYGLCILFALRSLPRGWWRLLLRSWPLLLLVGFACVSVAWSLIPSAAGRRAIALLLTTAFAFYVTQHFRPEEFYRVLYVALGFYLCVQVLAAIVVPHIAIVSVSMFHGDWQGLTGMKNEFGRTLGLILVLCTVMRHLGRRRWYQLSVLGVGAAVVLLFLSGSRTPLLAAAAAVPLTYAAKLLMGGPFGGGRLRLSPYLGALAATFLIALAVLLVLAIAPLVLEALGRDFTFSGRTKLWGWATHLGMEQPWLGAGYRSFWIDAHTKYFFETFAWNQDANGNLSDSYHGPDHSHSSYVDTFVELGFVGCGLLAVLMLSVFRRMKRAFRSDDVAALPFAAVSLYMIFYSLTERSFLQHTLDIWMLFMIFYFYTSMEIRSPFPAVRPSIRGAPVPGYASDAQIRPAG